MTEVTVPALEKGRAKAGKTLGLRHLRPDVRGHRAGRGRDGPGREAGCRARSPSTRSAPAYRKCWSCTAGGDLQDELNRLSKEGRWADMGALVDDGPCSTFAVVAPLDEVATKLVERWGDVVTRMNSTPYETAPGRWDAIVATLRAA